MAINVEIRLDLSGISQKAIENALANRIAEIQRQEEDKIKREALEAKRNELEERRTDVKGIQDLPKFRKNPPKLELTSYDIKQKKWNMFWFRTENVPNQKRLRLYISNTAGSSFRELNLDWAYDQATIPVNGDPNAPADPDNPTPSSYLESFLPGNLELQHLVNKYDFSPTTTFVNPKVVAGNSSIGYSEARIIDSWIFNPRVSGLALSYTGPFVGVQRVVWQRVFPWGGARIAVLPLIDDICVVIVFTETVIQKKQIDFFRIKQGHGSVPTTTKDYGFGPSLSSTYNFKVPSIYRFAQSIRVGEEQGVLQDPTWEFLIFRVPPGFGKIASITARLTPYRTAESDAPTADNFDQTHGVTFALCASTSLPQHYKQYYNDKDYLTGQAKAKQVIQTEDNEDDDKPVWAPCKFVSPPLTIGTDPRFYNPDAFENDGVTLKSTARGYDLTEYYTDTLYNLETGTNSVKRIYRGYAKNWGISNLDQTSYMKFQQTSFKDVNEGDYLFIRIIEVARNHNGPYETTNYGTTRTDFHPASEEVNDDTFKFNNKTGGYAYKQLYNEDLYITIQTTEGTTFTLGDGTYSSSAYKETAHVIEDTDLTTYHNDLEGVEPNVRSFVVSDVALEEIETPGAIKGVGIDKLFNRLRLNEDSYQANIIEGEPNSVLAWGDYADKMFTNEYGSFPGKNLMPESEGTLFLAWRQAPYPTGYEFLEEVTDSEPPIDIEGYTDMPTDNPNTTGGGSVKVILPPPPRDAIYSVSSWNSYIENANLLNNFDYREGQPLLGKKYIFSVYVKVIANSIATETQSTNKEGGVYPGEVRSCETDKNYLDSPPGLALISLCHLSNKAGIKYMHEYTVQEVEIGSWFRIWFTIEINGYDSIRIDNWNGDFLSYLDVEIWGAQLEIYNDKGKPTKYMPRRRFAQVYRNGIYSDAVAKANAYQVIGMNPLPYWYDPNTIPLDGVNIGIGIGFENNYQVQDFIHELNSNPNNFGWPEEEDRKGEWSPAVYPALGAGFPITTPQNGGSPADGGFGAGPTQGANGAFRERCFYGAPLLNEGPAADRRNAVYSNENTQSPYDKYYAMAGERITQGLIGLNGIPVNAGLTGTTSSVRLNSNRCDEPGTQYGNFDTSSPNYFVGNNDGYDYNRTILSGCITPGYGSQTNKFNGSSTVGSMTGVNSGICSSDAGGGVSTNDAGYANSQSYLSNFELPDGSNGPAGEEKERAACEFKLDKAKKLKGWYKNQNYGTSELFLRSDAKSLPQIVQFTSWGDLERNAESLRNLGYDPEVILGIGTNAPPAELDE